MSRRPAWTLRRRLVVGTIALVAVGFIATSIATILALQSFTYDRLDEQVLQALDLANGPEDTLDQDGGQDASDVTGPGRDIRQRVGTLLVVLDEAGDVVSSAYTTPDGVDAILSSSQLEVFETTTFEPRTPTTVDLGSGLGSFRVAAEPGGDSTIIVGSSLDDVTATTSALTIILCSVAGLTLLVLVVALSLIVGRNLRPLDRVAVVAQRVAGRQLADGAVNIPDRVSDEDTDPSTEVGRVGNSLNTLLGHIQAALESRQHSEEQLRRFIADASHELRTPLASIRGYAQLSISEDAPMTSTQERSFDRIAAESERMSSLVDDLLLLARLDAGQTLRRDRVDLTLLVIDAVSDAHATDPARDWRLDVPEDPISVPGDDNRLRQVIANLLRNARTHTPAGTTVTASLGLDDTHAEIRVIDTGPGIDPTVRGRLFDRFARGDDSRNRDAGSTGLGLSIAQAIVNAHNGTIAVKSEPGSTDFIVRLPLRVTESANPDSAIA